MAINENSLEVTISFLHPHGPPPSCVYPQQPDILSIPLSEVLMKVDQRKATGQTHTLTYTETQLMTEKLSTRETITIMFTSKNK
jgi:hypothetical protein